MKTKSPIVLPRASANGNMKHVHTMVNGNI